jgi:enamine deaminase RidA (YjgF/YER057c/UK114 family)
MRWLLTSVVLLVPAVVLLAPVLLRGQSPAPHIKRTNPPILSRPTGYTHVVEVSGAVKTIYISGQLAMDREGNLVGGSDMKAQSEQVFKNLETALAAAGATFSDLVKINTYVTDLSQIQAYREVRARYFGAESPASTLVQVVRLVRPEYLLEVEVIAAVREGARVTPARQ